LQQSQALCVVLKQRSQTDASLRGKLVFTTPTQYHCWHQNNADTDADGQIGRQEESVEMFGGIAVMPGVALVVPKIALHRCDFERQGNGWDLARNIFELGDLVLITSIYTRQDAEASRRPLNTCSLVAHHCKHACILPAKESTE
jgi:hypothetical protein